jgi:hypothetical protein
VRPVDVPKRLELSYFWRIKGSDFGKAGDEVLARNVDPNTLEQLRPRLDQINALYETVNPGDRYALTYIPGRGTELALNGENKGIIPGADFAAASADFFSSGRWKRSTRPPASISFCLPVYNG